MPAHSAWPSNFCTGAKSHCETGINDDGILAVTSKNDPAAGEGKMERVSEAIARLAGMGGFSGGRQRRAAPIYTS